MDEKHRQYCIKLGNPYMNDERYQKQYNGYENAGTLWQEQSTKQDNNWIKNSKKFTN